MSNLVYIEHYLLINVHLGHSVRGFQDDRCRMETLLGLMGDCQGGLLAPVGRHSGWSPPKCEYFCPGITFVQCKISGWCIQPSQMICIKTNRSTNSKVNISLHYLWRDNNKCQLTLATLVYTCVTEKQNYYSTGETLHGIQYTGCSKKTTQI